MKLIKTEVKGFSYVENKNGITYYFTYREPSAKHSKRKKILKCDEHNNKNLQNAISMKDNILKDNKIKTVLKNNTFNSLDFQNLSNFNENLEEGIVMNDFKINELFDIWHKKRYTKKYRQLKETYAGISEEQFNNDKIIQKKLYSVKKMNLIFDKNVRNSSIGIKKYEDLKRKDITTYFENELNQELSYTTKYNIIQTLKNMINSFRRDEYITLDNVFEKVRIPRQQRQRTRILSPEEIELLLKECKKYNKVQYKKIWRYNQEVKIKIPPNYNIYTAVYLAVITAGRSSTVLTIRKKDIDLTSKTIELVNHKRNNHKYKIPLSDDAAKWFEKKLKYYEDDEYLVRYYKRQKDIYTPLAAIPKIIYKIMDELFNQNVNKKTLDGKDSCVNFHTIRRSIATNLAIADFDIYKIKKLLDHNKVDTTELYLNLSYQDYKKDLSIWQNELFKGFRQGNEIKTLDNDKKEEQVISDIKQNLIKAILAISNNENNEMLMLALETLSEDDLKHKLAKYV
jgi:integrase